MNPSTASGRLVKDLLWDMIVQLDKDICFHCNKPMQRDNFSIEHKKPWLDSEDPVGLYFDLDNISFSHLKCNFERARKPNKIYEDSLERGRESSKRYWNSLSKEQQKELRKRKYHKYGC